MYQLKLLFIFACSENKKAFGEIEMIVEEVVMVFCFKDLTAPEFAWCNQGKSRRIRIRGIPI
jgi:hypothetical protein